MQACVENKELVVRFEPTREMLALVKAIPGRRYEGAGRRWILPYTSEVLSRLRQIGFDVSNVPLPTAAEYRVDALPSKLGNPKLMVWTPYSPTNADLMRAVPERRMWDPQRKCWIVMLSRAAVDYLERAFPQMTWSADALAAKQLTVSQPHETVDILDYRFGGRFAPFEHQRLAFAKSRDAETYALFMEMGTGKSRVIVDTACDWYNRGKITGVLVIAPNSVKTNWVTDEIPAHTPDWIRWRAAYYISGKPKSYQPVMHRDPACITWLTMNVEALSSKTGEMIAQQFLQTHDALMVIDESSRIKTPSAKRTKACLRLGKLAKARRILSGTPVTQGPLDLYAQFAFLDPNILGFSSYYAFRNHFAIMGGWLGKEILGYANLEELTSAIEPYSFRITRAECLDLPPKIYQKLVVELTGEQRRLYDQMRDEMIASLTEETSVSTTMILTQMLRLQQITGGFLPLEVEEGKKQLAIPGTNPKINALLELAADVQGKVIVWARFRAELDLIARALRGAYGHDSVVEFHGGVSEPDRIVARREFQDDTSPVRFFVGQTETGGLGLTLTQAKTVVYYSNSFSLETRLQSEDRAHRIGQSSSVTYVDLVADDTLDAKLLRVLQAKKSMADMITKDSHRLEKLKELI